MLAIILGTEHAAAVKRAQVSGRIQAAVIAMIPPPLRNAKIVIELREAGNGRTWLRVKSA